jgi:outer membrane protein assembly factor BamB
MRLKQLVFLRLLLAMSALLWVACASEPDKPQPKPLQNLTSTVSVQQIWKRDFDRVRFPLSMTVHGSGLTVANSHGEVVGLELDSGRELWKIQLGNPLSAGVGSDGRFSAVVSRDNELFVLDKGKLAWRQRLNVSVITAPLIAGERVFVMGIDRSVHAFDVKNGRKLWGYQKSNDALILAQPTVLAAFKDTLLVGLGPKLVGLDPDTGVLRWDTVLATPRGTNEVERLADLVSPIGRTDETVCARAFQVAVACVNAQRGALIWSRSAAGVHGVSANHEIVLGFDASSRATAWRVSDGSVAWAREDFLYRDVTAPSYSSSVKAFVVGDRQGFVHWISPVTGDTVVRLPTDGSAMMTAPVISGQTTLLLTSAGRLFAFRVQ